MKKIVTVAIILIAVIVIALAAFIKIYVTPDRVKAFIIPEVEKALNRKVDIGEINISLIKGITLKDFAIKEADQESDFIRFEDFVLKFKLLPLLSKKIIIDELRLVSPDIRIRRSKDGKFNFEGIGEDTEVKEKADGEPADKAVGLPISLLVNKIEIQDAKFSLTDMTKELPDIKSTTNINISIKSTDGSELLTEGEIDLKLDEIIMSKPSKKHITNISAGLKYSVRINLESRNIRIEKADLIIQKIPVSIKGEIRNLSAKPEIDIAVVLPKTKAADILETASLFVDIKGLSLSGSLAADIKLKGMPEKLETLKADGSIKLDKTGISYNEMNALLDGNIRLNEESMDINLKGTIDKNTIELKGSVGSYLDNPEINLNIYSKKLFLDELIPVGKTGDNIPAGNGSPAPPKAPEESAPIDLKLSATGEIRVDTAVYKDMTMSDFRMKYKFRENKLKIPELSAKAGKGSLNLNTLIDLSKPGYKYRLSGKVDSMHADEIINSFFPEARDTVFGIVSLNLKMKGAGTLPGSIKKNLAAESDFNMKDGKISGAQITRRLSLFLDIAELETINLKEAEGTVKIKNGVARIESIFSSDDLSMDPSGEIGLDETLDLAFDLKLSPRLTGKAMSSKISEYIKSEEGWGIIPLKVSGTFSDPVYMINIEKAGKRAIKKEAEKFIDKLLDEHGEEIKKELEPVKEFFKGLFQ